SIFAGAAADVENPLARMEERVHIAPDQVALRAADRGGGPEGVVAGGEAVEEWGSDRSRPKGHPVAARIGASRHPICAATVRERLLADCLHASTSLEAAARLSRTRAASAGVSLRS